MKSVIRSSKLGQGKNAVFFQLFLFYCFIYLGIVLVGKYGEGGEV